MLGFRLAGVLARWIAWRSTGGRVLQAVDRGALYVLAKAAHVGLYLLLATVVTLGVVNAFVRGYLIYGLFQLPHFGDRAWRHRLADWHGLAADEVLILSGFHAPRPWSTTACGAMACSGACCRAGLGDAPPASRRRHRPRCGATHRQWEAAMFIDRRRFGLGLAGVALGAALPAAASAAGEGATVLTAGRRTLEVDGRAAPVLGITGPDGRPGLVAEVGSRFHVVMAIDGDRFPGAMRDTVLVPPRTTITVAFDADNPGHWAFHCHNLYHLAVGMMTTLRYEGT